MIKPNKLLKELDLVDPSDTQLKVYIKSAIIKHDELLENGEYPKEVMGLNVTEVQSEDVQDNVYRMQTKYPFVSELTYLEFQCFARVIDAHLAQQTKRKRGRPRKEDQTSTDTIIKEVELMKKAFPGLRKNQMTNNLEYQKIDDERQFVWHVVQGSELNLLSTTMAVEHGVMINPQRAVAAFEYAAKQNPFEPTVDLMQVCRRQHPDMTKEYARELLSTIGTRLLGPFPDEPSIDGETLRDRFLARFFVGMAFLARNPGSTPTWMPIIIGEQGCGKSQLCKHMIPESHEKQLFAQLSTSLDQLAREPSRLHVGFLLEFPEVDDKMSGKRATEQMKNLVTTTADQTRLPYDRLPVSLVRRLGFIGTTNREDLFRDGTGTQGERRYLPFQIQDGFKTPWRELRDGLNVEIWAAADILASDFKGEEPELKAFTKEEQMTIAEWQQNYSAVDPWESRLLLFCSMRQEFTASEVLSYVDVPVAQQSQGHLRRINDLIRRKLGDRVKRMQKSRNGRRTWVWRMIDPPTAEVMLDKVASLDTVKVANGQDF